MPWQKPLTYEPILSKLHCEGSNGLHSVYDYFCTMYITVSGYLFLSTRSGHIGTSIRLPNAHIDFAFWWMSIT